MTVDVFAGATTPAQTPSAADLVGEGKRYKDNDALAKAKQEADTFIEQLKTELKGVREIAERNINAENQLEAMKNELKSLRDASGSQSRENTTPALSERDIEALVERTATKMEKAKTAEQNVNDANARVIRHFGTVEQAANAVRAKAAEMGVSTEYLRDVAAKSPTAFLKIVDVAAQSTPENGGGSFIQPSATTPAVPAGGNHAPGTYEFAENVRKTDPGKYWSKDFQMKHIWDATIAGTYKVPGKR